MVEFLPCTDIYSDRALRPFAQNCPSSALPFLLPAFRCWIHFRCCRFVWLPTSTIELHTLRGGRYVETGTGVFCALIFYFLTQVISRIATERYLHNNNGTNGLHANYVQLLKGVYEVV